MTAVVLILHTIGFAIFVRRVSKLPKIAGMGNYSSYLLLSDMGLIFSTAVLGITKFDNYGPTRSLWPQVNEEQVLTFGYLAFFALWNLGVLLYTRRAIKIPEERKSFVNSVTRVIFGLITTALLVAFIIQLPEDKTSDFYSNLTILFFAVFTIASIFLYIYFYRNLGFELKSNTSKLTLSKIVILRYSIILLLGVTVLILLSAILFFLIDDPISEAWTSLITYGFIAILNLIAGVFTYWSAFIPDWLRKRFDISSKRFQRMIVIKERVDTIT